MRKRKQNRESIIILIVSVLFHLLWVVIDGVEIRVDSASYINMVMSREPVYPIFLALNRSIFGEEGYLMVVVVLQALLGAYATWRIAQLVGEYSESKYLLPYATVFIQFAFVLICRFGAVRQMIYTNSIETEGIGFSLYLLFMIQLFRYIMYKKRSNLLWLLYYCIVLSNLRKQMLITFPIVIVAYMIYHMMRMEIKWREVGKVMLCLVLAGIVSLFVPRAYNYVLRGEAISYTKSGSFILTPALYSSSRDDAMLFNDAKIEELFVSIINDMEEEGLTHASVSVDADWRMRASHFANSYDAISYGVVNPNVSKYVEQSSKGNYIEDAQFFDGAMNEMSKVLVQANLPQMINVFWVNLQAGFMNTIAKNTRVLDVFVVVAYLSYLGLGILSVLKKKYVVSLLFLMTTIGIIVNGVLVAVTIFTQTRYMIYHFTLFYIVMIWMAYENCDKIKRLKW